jgi:hypothetical protein
MTDPILGLQTRIARKPDLPATAVDDDIVILNIATQNYVGLDDIGSAIWGLLDEPRRVDDICRAMAERYDGPPEDIRADVLTFLGELVAEGLIVVAEP